MLPCQSGYARKLAPRFTHRESAFASGFSDKSPEMLIRVGLRFDVYVYGGKITNHAAKITASILHHFGM